MMSYIATALLVSSMLFSPAAHTPEKAVTFYGSLQPNTAEADHFTVTVELDIKDGWHTYGEVGEGSEVTVKWSASAVFGWSDP